MSPNPDTSPTSSRTFGIASLGLALPRLALPVEELASLRGVDPLKYTVGLGCGEISLCAKDEDVVDLAVTAAERALERWEGEPGDLGLLAVGTESAADMSRPLSAWVAERLGLRGAVRSYEVKHACYGGTLAVRQALEWKASGAAGHKAALVIAADQALYAPEDPGEPTQGAGAVAMVVDQPRVALLEPRSFPWSEPAFDFWRPVGEAFPRVDGPLSLNCYQRAVAHCFKALIGDSDSQQALEAFSGIAFHVPFPKMVRKAVIYLGQELGWDEAQTARFYSARVEPTMEWNRRCGNAYTASLWISVAKALAGLAAGERMAAFSYGSGFGAELLTLTAGPEAAVGAWTDDMTTDLVRRRVIDAQAYSALRGLDREAAA